MKFIFRYFLLFIALSTQAQDASILIKTCEKAMGGQKAYSKTKLISWTFFGRRTLWWDKHEQLVRIEIPAEEKVLLIDLKTDTGRASIKGAEITNPEELAKLMRQAKETWINDSYWLVMPFKLNDPGVNKTYLGKKTTEDGIEADVLELTFNEVGVTPQNKYHIYFHPETGLVCQWDFYRNASDEKPGFSMPWRDYKTYGNILLSGDRGRAQLSNISVSQKPNAELFKSLELLP